MVKKGDTLVEVLLAVGIFSMIAISVVAVMSGGTSSAQTALETTLTREEIDAQAEALRFIHDAYVNERDSDNTSRSAISLWQKIVESAYIPTEDNEKDKTFLQYNPESCSTNDYPSNAFILDTRNLDKGADAFHSGQDIFAETSTYPQLRFKDIKNDEEVDNNTLVTEDKATELASAEGIYIVAVADKNTTTILDLDGKPVKKNNPAFHDFYIRSCWYGTDSDTPSTISTVIRLHNPDIETEYYAFSATFWSGTTKIKEVGLNEARRQITFSEPDNAPGGNYDFIGWCDEAIDIGASCSGKTYTIGDSFFNSNRDKSHFDFYAIWKKRTYQVAFDPNGGIGSMPSQIINVGENTTLNPNKYTKTNYTFQGWSTSRNGSVKYTDGQTVKDIANPSEIRTLYAVWKPVDYYVDVNPVVDDLTYMSGFNFRDFFAQTVGIDGLLEHALSYYNDQKISAIFFDILEDGMCYRSNWRSGQTIIKIKDPRNRTILLSFRDYLGILMLVHKDISRGYSSNNKKAFSFNVYVDGKLDATDVTDYYKPLPYGSKVEVRPNNTPGYNTPSNETKTVNGSITFSPKWNLKFYQVEIYPVVNGIARQRNDYNFKVNLSSLSQRHTCPNDSFYDSYYNIDDSPTSYFKRMLPYGTIVQVYIDYDSTSYTPRRCLKDNWNNYWGIGITRPGPGYYYGSPYTKTEYDQSWIVRDDLIIKPQWSCPYI